MSENTVVIREFSDQYRALMVVDQLKSAGIECFLSNDNLNHTNTMILALPVEVQLHVFEKDLDEATALLVDIEASLGFDEEENNLQ